MTSTTTTSSTTSNNNNNNNDNAASSSSTASKPRQSFNFVFIKSEPELVSVDPVAKWTVAQVAEWLNNSDLSVLVDTFSKEDIDGVTLLELKDSDLKDIGVSLGNRKKLEKALAPLQQAAGKTPSTTKTKEFSLPKGFAPHSGLTAEQRNHVKLNGFDTSSKMWIRRDVPLNDEELACWEEQAQWLVCPISGRKWLDVDSILGVGLYHAPRAMSEKENQRGVDDEIRATQNKQKKRESEPTINESNFEKTFSVYPSVHPPPADHIDENLEVGDVPLAYIDVVAGPTFDARAFNWGIRGHPDRGIKAKKDRGVLSMDQQYNAFNFIYYILRAENSYERKIITNRLSFFIDESHGSRVFPSNIESQLSLLVYRDKRLCKDSTSLGENKRQALLASAIRKAIPRVLRAVIMEIMNGRATALAERIDHSIRTYLLIHQISIKLVLTYQMAYEKLYKSIFLWIQNPFAPMCEEDWPNIEDVLIGASLVGIPWALMRESFVKKLIFVALKNAPKFRGTDLVWAAHLFDHNKSLFHIILYEISFLFNTNRSIIQMDRIYSRCAGSLPRAERERMKTTIQQVEQIESFIEVWASLGMSTSHNGEDVAFASYFTNILENAQRWRQQKLPELKIIVPSALEQVTANHIQSNGLVLRSELDRQKEAALITERLKHRGFPPLNKHRKMDRNVCLYPECGKRFSCRDHLFRHLNIMIEPERMHRSYHQDHFNLKVTASAKSLDCRACNEVFTTLDEIHAHYAARGVPGFSSASQSQNSNNNSEKQQEKQQEKQAAQQSNLFADNSCVICMDRNRDAVNIPCGHLICCYECGMVVKECAICRVPIKDVIKVYCS